jgi:sortase A
MKKNTINIIMFLLFVCGLFLLLYPFVSDAYNQRISSKAIVDYDSLLKNKDNSEYDKMFEDAESFNSELLGYDNPFNSYKKIGGYHKLLNLKNDGMIGYIRIKKIKVELPIYLGTSKETLSRAVGHLEGSSLPIGGVNTHAVLSAHRGLPSSMLFTNLDKMEIGDTFEIRVLNRLLTYQVDNIQIVEPHQVDLLRVVDDKDYVTLMTCTPYGINTHRLLVRGVRIENSDEEFFVTTEAFKVNRITVMLFIIIPVVLILLVVVIFKPVELNIKKIKDKYIYPSRYKK